jgi:molybdopterin-guanine dinucleotide biosynthesis protein B
MDWEAAGGQKSRFPFHAGPIRPADPHPRSSLMGVPRLHVIGRKNAGKTTLVVEWIELLRERGLRVGSIKHTHHRHELDVPGKDSFRHREAGAAPVAILSPAMTAVFRPNPSGIAGDGYAWLDHLWLDCDLVLVEGDSQTKFPKVEVWRPETQDRPLAESDPSILALISDTDAGLALPRWPRSDPSALLAHLLDWLGRT